jgi:hypothetical protein
MDINPPLDLSRMRGDRSEARQREKVKVQNGPIDTIPVSGIHDPSMHRTPAQTGTGRSRESRPRKLRV